MKCLALLVVLVIAAGCGDVACMREPTKAERAASIAATNKQFEEFFKTIEPPPAPPRFDPAPAPVIVPQRSPVVAEPVQTGYRVLPRPKTPSTGMLNPRTGRPFEHAPPPVVAENPKCRASGEAPSGLIPDTLGNRNRGNPGGPTNDQGAGSDSLDSALSSRKPIAAGPASEPLDIYLAIRIEGGRVVEIKAVGPNGRCHCSEKLGEIQSRLKETPK
jgi:hypothetical protein